MAYLPTCNLLIYGKASGRRMGLGVIQFDSTRLRNLARNNPHGPGRATR